MHKKTFFVTLSLLILLPLLVLSNTSETTFPKESAGIAAYTKINNITEDNNATKLNEVQAFLEQEGTTVSASEKHVIGTIPISINIISGSSGGQYFLLSIPVNVYFDIEGWLVAYLNKEEPSSKIIQWTGYSANNLPPNILEEAIEKLIDGTNHTHSSIEYYHFQHEDAEKIAIIIDVADNKGEREKNYSVTTPGTVYEASYSLYYSNYYNNSLCTIILSVNNEIIRQTSNPYWCRGSASPYDFYPENTFLPKTPNSVVTKGFEEKAATEIRLGVGTVLLYSVD